MLARTGFKRCTYQRPARAPARPIRQVAPTVIAQEVVAMPRQPRYADRHLLDMARGQACLIQSPLCNRDPETVVACHGAGVALGKGLGYKIGDHFTAFGCSSCNHYTDAYSGANADEKRMAFELGHVRQVLWWQAVATNPAAPARDRVSAQAALDQLKRFTT